ncbi:hypothetical protein [Bacillus sp. S3]|uniref:hypothetical protein n=1 Tax=Bacillus sp. S3 TaxID=486398 RepID=UPI00168149C5|nr:hypothetical protein [Bacillus sp. S3]
MFTLDGIIKDVETANDSQKFGEWKEKINWLIEQAKEAEMLRMEKVIEREFKESNF